MIFVICVLSLFTTTLYYENAPKIHYQLLLSEIPTFSQDILATCYNLEGSSKRSIFAKYNTTISVLIIFYLLCNMFIISFYFVS